MLPVEILMRCECWMLVTGYWLLVTGCWMHPTEICSLYLTANIQHRASGICDLGSASGIPYLKNSDQ
ncbi:MAG: hypothetical protein E6H09_15940 [Bacteroidetes bacterium]|nr:MAG: hypothetical protein E6H09_15940 [Bacteroidota bacterium]